MLVFPSKIRLKGDGNLDTIAPSLVSLQVPTTTCTAKLVTPAVKLANQMSLRCLAGQSSFRQLRKITPHQGLSLISLLCTQRTRLSVVLWTALLGAFHRSAGTGFSLGSHTSLATSAWVQVCNYKAHVISGTISIGGMFSCVKSDILRGVDDRDSSAKHPPDYSGGWFCARRSSVGLRLHRNPKSVWPFWQERLYFCEVKILFFLFFSSIKSSVLVCNQQTQTGLIWVFWSNVKTHMRGWK